MLSSFSFQSILTRLAAEIPATGLKRIPIIGCDKWVAASGLQKSIRRGDQKLAASFALPLAYADRRMLWRRLLVTAFEDCSMGGPDVVQEVVAAYKCPVWRREIGDTELAVHLARKMAASVKSRYLTEMLFYIDLSVETAKARTCAEKAGNKKLGNIILDPDRQPHERFTALWALAGTKAYPAKGFTRTGDIAVAADALRRLPAPPELTETCIAVLRDMPYPLPLFMPLAWTIFEQQKTDLRVHQERPLSSPEFETVPAFAIDPLYTRIGQASVRQLQKTVPALKGYTPAQLGETLFFICGENIDQRLTSDALDRFRESSIHALMLDLGLDQQEYAVLTRTLIKHWDLYNELRLKQLERSLYGAEADLFSAAEAKND
ncbi:MAG: hypothetical protein K8R48_08455 [Alphaproteobacteria bacterium]|nr:hypothetical protein [Alphaproteobacteria bacterium]